MREGVATGVAPGMVAAVTNRGGIVYERAVGVRSSVLRDEMQLDTVFRIASMTKLVTSLAVMMLVEEGKIELDQPFASYFPGYRQPGVLKSFDAKTKHFDVTPPGHPITVRQLLTHTSGYGYWFLHAPLLDLTGRAPELFDLPFLTSAPGERFTYGVSTDVLGQAVEPVSGASLESFFAKRIFGPLAMNSTSYRLPAVAERLAPIHARSADGFVEQPNEVEAPPAHGGGGLYSTAADYLALLRLFMRGGEVSGRQLIDSRYIRMMTENQIGDLRAERQRTALPSRTCDFLFMDGTQKFGFGVMIETEDRPNGRSAGSYGWGGIYNTYFWVDPRAGLGAVLLMQTSPFSDPSSVAFYRRFEASVYASEFSA